MKNKIFNNLYYEITVFFLLTLLTLSLIIWILQAVNYLDIVSEDGHGIATYFKFSLLTIPKIVSKTFLLSYFIALYYILVSYEENNQLLIYWTNGISKKKFLNKIIFFSTFLLVIFFLFTFFITPWTQDKARSYIRSSSLDFFPSLIKPRKFIDTVEKLTVYIDKKDKQNIQNIILKDSSGGKENIQIIVAKKGKIIFDDNNRFLLLSDGKILNTNTKKKSTVFNFKETTFNLNNYKTKTTTSKKIQEIDSIEILRCVMLINNMRIDNPLNTNCQKRLNRNYYQELYKRLYIPFYLLLVVLITSSLILKSQNNLNYKFYKVKVFITGMAIVVFTEISINLITLNNTKNLLILLLLPLLMVIFYTIFSKNYRLSH